MQSRTLSPTLPRQVMITIAAAALIALAAKIQVPFWPVPITLHTLAVFLIAALLGPRMGLAAMTAYLSAGLAGLPVFSGSPERGIGLAYAMGPTGGYLLGYLASAWVVGRLAQGRGPLAAAGAMLAGLAVVYAAGLAWLAGFVPANQLLAAGLLPFLAGDLAKIVLATALIALWKRAAS